MRHSSHALVPHPVFEGMWITPQEFMSVFPRWRECREIDDSPPWSKECDADGSSFWFNYETGDSRSIHTIPDGYQMCPHCYEELVHKHCFTCSAYFCISCFRRAHWYDEDDHCYAIVGPNLCSMCDQCPAGIQVEDRLFCRTCHSRLENSGYFSNNKVNPQV